MTEIEQLPLLRATPDSWVGLVLANFDEFLLDHASCERKAAASALSLLARHADQPQLVETMVTVAREELEHFGQVHRFLVKRGQRLGPDEKDPYVNSLLTAVRKESSERLLDRLLVASLIEARSCERFYILAKNLDDNDEMQSFYRGLYRSEAGHFRVFLRLAEKIFGNEKTMARWPVLCAFEAEVMTNTPLRPAVH